VLINAYGASKLTDFGIAARAGTPTIPAGSVAYAPPEQFDGGPASAASDVYAATATFYECLAGQPPFTGPSMYAVIEQHRSADVPMDPIPEPLQPIVARGLAKDPRYRPSDAAALAAALRTAAVTACGPEWERRGRSQLGEAALLLALLWPSAGVPALQGSAVEHVHLSHQPAQQAHGTATAHHAPAKAALHRWHLRHVLHMEHVARTATVAVTAAAVVAAGVTVTATSRAPSGPGTPAHPAVAAYQAPLAATLPATLTSSNKPVNGDTYVEYGPNTADNAFAKLSGTIAGATAGEVARLYAQQFPYTSTPALVQSVTLSPVGGTATYSFTVSPGLATRYQVKLFRSTAATTLVATSAIDTVYVTSSYRPDHDLFHNGLCFTRPTCSVALDMDVYVPPAALQAEMSKRKYLYLAHELGPLGTTPATLTSLSLATNGTITKLQRIADNEYEIAMSITYNVGNAPLGSSSVTFGFCTQQTEAQDGIGLPGPSACGASSVPAFAYYLIATGGSSS
jgi:eukaryotic-like serine/threonine-protein kinase